MRNGGAIPSKSLTQNRGNTEQSDKLSDAQLSLFVSKEQRSKAKWTKRDKKREIKCKKSRKRKRG